MSIRILVHHLARAQTAGPVHLICITFLTFLITSQLSIIMSKSIANKLDTLIAEFSFFDVVSFSETWLHDEISSNELPFPSFHPPERKDRADNRYGGVILYVKNNLSYIRRQDLELNNLECIWVQIKI